jgi:hypothetical protein
MAAFEQGPRRLSGEIHTAALSLPPQVCTRSTIWLIHPAHTPQNHPPLADDLSEALAVTSLMATTFSAWVAARASLITIVLAIPLNALLLLDFTRTILYIRISSSVLLSQVVHILLSALPFAEIEDVRRKNSNETAPQFPTRLFSLQVTTLLFVFSVSFQRIH